MNQTWMRRAGVTVAALAGALGSSAQATPVTVIKVGYAAADGGFALEGRLEAVKQATVAAQTAGNVLALRVKAGDTVRAGQSIAQIDGRDSQASVARSDAALAQAEAEGRNAKLHVERTRELSRQGFVSQAALDVAETQWQASQAGVRQAQAGKSQAQLAHGFAHIVAPFAGVVLETHLQAGDLAGPGRPIVTLYAPQAMRAVVDLPLSRSTLARAATQVSITLADGRVLKPERRTELKSAEAVSQTVQWRLDLPPAAQTVQTPLFPGQMVKVTFEGIPTTAKAIADKAPGAAQLRVPAPALLRRGELTAVYVAADGKFQLRQVRVGRSSATGVDVLAGLREGESIAADAQSAGLQGATPAR
jgi:RND family efflux transporter MFP subunit